MNEKNLYRLIAKNITEFRCKKGMSVGELAELAAISERYLYRIEAGERHPGVATLIKIANVLDVEISSITENLPEEIHDI